MRDPTHDKHQAEGPLTEDLVRDVHVTAPRVPSLRDLRYLSLRNRCCGRFGSGDEPVTAPMSSLDESRLAALIGKGLPNLGYGDLQNVVADVYVRPYSAK